MNSTVHRIYILTLFLVGIGSAALVGVQGFPHFTANQEKADNRKADLDAKVADVEVQLEMLRQGLSDGTKTEQQLLKEKADLHHEATLLGDWEPKGLYGHGLGIVGSAMMILGVAMYSTRKRYRKLRFTGKIKHWLEFHIFLCLLGPTLVLYHTTFKFGGIVAVSAWSMIFVALSGILGRYVYTQIPRSIEGKELSMDDLAAENLAMRDELQKAHNLSAETLDRIDAISQVQAAGPKSSVLKSLLSLVKDDLTRRSHIHAVRAHLKEQRIPGPELDEIMRIAKKKSLLLRRIAFLDTAQSIFHYWHVIHLPFSIIMFLILAIHVGITVSLGYVWIF